jgi:methyl-accepting chemotaxis protein
MVNMIRNMNLGLRSFFAFGLISILILLLGINTLFQMTKVEHITQALIDVDLVVASEGAELRGEFLAVVIQSYKVADVDLLEDKQQLQLETTKAIDYFKKEIQEIHEIVPDAATKATINKVIVSFEQYVKIQDQLNEQVNNKNISAIKATKQQLGQLRVAIMQELAEFEKQYLAMAASSEAEVSRISDQAQFILMMGLLFTLLFSVLIAWIYSESVREPVKQAASLAETIARNDLTSQLVVSSHDQPAEMLRSLLKMQANLKNTLSQISRASGRLATTSEELSVVTDQSTTNLHKQSAELQLAVHAVNELTAAISDVAQNAADTSHAADQVETASKRGQQKVQQTMVTLKTLATGIEQSLSGVQSLFTKVQDIGSVLDVIRAIAEQTNLLALNAAIEAARAGESGRGFAVVADEVRALAHRTQESTKQIEMMINSVKQETDKTVRSINDSNQQAISTMQVASETEDAIQQISSMIDSINQQSTTIAAAVEQQSIVSKEVDRNLKAIQDLAAQSVLGANETNASSQELAKVAEELNGLVMQFKM